MNLLRLKPLPLLIAAALLQLPLSAAAERVCELGDARRFSAITELCPVVDGLARIQIGYRWGFVDTSGKLAIAPQFDAVEDFSEGFAAAQVDEKWGLIDKQGQWVVKPTLQELDPFSNGLARASADGKDGYIDTSGKWVIAPQFFGAGPFAATSAVAHDGAYNYFLIDRAGRVIKRFPKQVLLDRDASRTGLFDASFHPDSMLVNLDGRRLPFPKGAESYQNGRFIGTTKVKRGEDDVDVYGLMDLAGKWVVPPAFRKLEKFDEQLAVAAPYMADASAPSLLGLVDKKGKFVVKPVYEHLAWRENGLYQGIRAGGGSKADMLDAKGKLLFSLDCADVRATETAGPLSIMSGCKQFWLVHRTDGLVKTLTGEWKVEAVAGHVLLEKDTGGDDEGGQFEIYNAAGKRVAGSDPKDKFFSQHFHHVGMLPATAPGLPLAVFGNFRSNLTGFLTRDYKLVTRADWEYDSVLLHYSGVSGEKAQGPVVMKGPKGFGAVDLQGNWVVQPIYEKLSAFEHGLAFASTEDGEKLLVDSAGKTHARPEGVYRLERTGPMRLNGETEEGAVSVDLKTGKVTPLTEPAVEESYRTVNGLTATSKDDKWGLMNAAGAWVLAPSLANEPKPLMHDKRLAGWMYEDGGMGLLDPQGKQLSKPVYNSLTVDDKTGLLIAQQDGYLHSVLAANGKPLLAPVNGSYTGLGDGWFKADLQTLHGLVDQRGEWVVKPGRDEFQLDTRYYKDPRPYTVAADGRLIDFAGRVSTRAAPLALTMDEKSQWWWPQPTGDDDDAQDSVLYGFNFKERVRVPGKATEQTFSEGLIPFTPSNPKHAGKVGLADDKGKVIGLYAVKDIGAMRDGMAKVSKEVALTVPGKKRRADDGETVTRYGFLNRAGKLAVPASFEQAADFSGQRATVLIDSGLAMIDASGKIVLQGAWQCGRTAVLMDSKRNVLWPEEARAVTSCKR